MNNKGLILIELIVATVILGIIVLIIVSMTSVNKKSTDINTILKKTKKVRCIGWFKFITSNGWKTEQVLNEHGCGIKCD